MKNYRSAICKLLQLSRICTIIKLFIFKHEIIHSTEGKDMKYIVSGKEMAKIDDYTINVIGLPQMVLMERAALSIYNFIYEKFPNKSKVLVVVESGNNGGDGLAVARMLNNTGYDVDIYWVDKLSTKSQGFEAQLDIARKLNLKFIDEIVNYGYDVVVDGMFGVGLNRALTGEHAEVIKQINDIDAYKVAIDIPSGIDSYTGFVLGVAFKADTTITFGFSKLGMLMGMGFEYSGKVIVADIGFPHQAVDFIEPRLYTYDETDLEEKIPYRRSDTHKGSYGKIGVIAGSKNMAGAAMFAAESAYRMGCGLVKICTVEANREIIQTKLPEAVLTTYNPEDKSDVREAIKSTMAWSDVIILGSGLGTDLCAKYVVEKVLKNYDKTIVLDADGLNIVSEDIALLDESKADIIITPHLLEMSRLTGDKVGDIKENKYDIARDFAKEHGVIVVLKDARTIVSNGEQQAYINITGNNGMATGGSGDVLAGIIAGLCGQDLDAFEAAKLGVCMHGMAGQEAAISRGRYSMIASDIVRSITKVLEGDYYVN